MKITTKHFLTFVFLATFSVTAFGQQPPRLFFPDLTSGPNTGGENGNGTIVTLTGKRFGSTQGTSTVTVGSGTVAAYLLWSDTKIAVAIGSATTSGNIVVHTGNGSSNGVPFTVRSGNIYCVSTSGNDANSGQFPSSCWATLVHAKNSMAAGDIAYAENGVQATTVENYGTAIVLDNMSGTASAPLALVAYPGATVTIGTSTMSYGIRPANQRGGPFSNWVIAGMYITAISAMNIEDNLPLPTNSNYRIADNEMTCPNGTGASGCMDTDNTDYIELLGNYVHDAGNNCDSGCKLYHAVYLATNANHTEAAWNTIDAKGGCRALQLFNSSGKPLYDLHVHDNWITDAICDGINLGGVNAGNGPVEAYNNVIFHAGTGPDPSGQAANYTCINVNGKNSSTAVELYNNTMYDCGLRLNTNSGGMSLYINTDLRNNILYQISSEPYFSPSDGSCSNIQGTNNLWYGAGALPTCSGLSANLNSDPLFASIGSDFHLQSSSPAIDSGVTISNLLTDFDGIIRPQLSVYDRGAYEFH